MAELQDRIILLNATPESNPPDGISYVFVDGNGQLKQLDSAGNTTEYIPKSGADFADMPSVGGDAIVESGSNSDGSWVKYADGTMICTATATKPDGVGGISISMSIGYRSGTGTGHSSAIFPQSLVDTNYVVQGDNDFEGAFLSAVEKGTSSTKVYLWSPVSLTNTGTTPINLIIIGNWK